MSMTEQPNPLQAWQDAKHELAFFQAMHIPAGITITTQDIKQASWLSKDQIYLVALVAISKNRALLEAKSAQPEEALCQSK